jgi:GAF domain-containing protein
MGLQKESLNYNKQLAALGLALQALREEETADGLIRVTLEYLKTELQYALVWLGLYDRANHQLLGKGGSSTNGDANFLKRRFSVQPGDLLEQVVVQQRPISIPNLQEESRAGEWNLGAQKFNIQGTVIFPIHYKQTCLGVVLLGSALWGTSPHAEEKVRLSMLLGELAKSLYLIDAEQQQQQAKRPDEALLNLLPKLRSLPNLKKRLEAIVDETHRFVAPFRTNIYWYEPERRYFWKRLGNRESGYSTTIDGKQGVEISVQEINSFYHALTADQLISVGESEGSFKADVTGRLMQILQARSLIAAPIIFQGELLGFLTTEGNKPRIWSEEEKTFVRGVAQLIALTAPLEEMEETIQQVKLDQSLTAEVSRALYSEEDWKNSLKKCAEQVYHRLKAERFLVLLYDKDLNKFELFYQNPPTGKRRALPALLDSLNPVDWQMIERSNEAIAIENLDEDLKLLAWRKVFLEFGMRSLLACSTALGKPLEAIVIIGHEATRSWNHEERDLLRAVSQQIGLLMHQLQLQRQTDQLQKNYQAVQWGLTTLQQTSTLERLEQVATQQLAQILQAPLVTLITWQPGRTSARVVAPVVKHQQQFGLTTDILIPILSDPLIQAALQADGLITLKADEIAPESRYWLSGSEIGHVLAIALRTAPDHEPTGLMVVGDRQTRTWTDKQFNVLGILASQLAWCRRNLALTDHLLVQKRSLEQLNWYKQRRLEEVYRILGLGVRRLSELTNPQDAMSNLRYPQVLRHLGSTLSAMTPLLKHEQWQLHEHYETIPLASLLKRALERADSAIKQRQLWFKVHNEANLNLGGDISKIEFVLHEILIAACARSPVGGRLDIWCRETDNHFLDISVTDQGTVEPELLEALQSGRTLDLLAPSLLDQPPGLHFAICQALIQRVGGEFSLYVLDDQRVLSSLQVPVTASVPTVKQEA